jgi:hypothetical protein
MSLFSSCSRIPVCSTRRVKSAIVFSLMIDDDRRLSFSRLPDFRQVAAGQNCKKTACHTPSKRDPGAHANCPRCWRRVTVWASARRYIDDRLGKLVGVPRALGVASHSGFLSGCLISSNEGTWMLSHHASSAAPQTVQTAPPVCGNKNFSSVRLYSAPQLHRTIVSILGICASNNSFSSGQSAFMR